MAVDVTLNTISSGYNLAKINENFTALDTALQDAVSLSGQTPNSMSADLDMNSQQLLNLVDPTLDQHAVTKAYGDANYGGGAATAALAAQVAAEAAQTAAETAQTGAETAETNAGVSETNAAASETNAATSATAAAASAAEGLYRDVVVLTFADSPYTILSASDGDFFKVDTSGGAVTINLPDLSLEANDFRCAIMKENVDVNAITVNRQGTDTINGGTSINILSQYETTNFIGDQSTLKWSATDATSGSSLQIANNLSDVASAATSRTNLGLAIGSDVQAFDATNVTDASTSTFTNKTFDANGTGNSITNIDVADLSNGTDGELITWDAAGAPAAVAVGTATHVLTSNGVGAAPTFQAAAGGGSFIQEVYTQTSAYVSGTTVIPLDDTIPQNTEGFEVITVTITPTSATSILEISFDGVIGNTSGTYGTSIALFQDSTAGALAATSTSVWTGASPISGTLRHNMVAGTTSATTFKIRIGPSVTSTSAINGASGRLYGGVATTSITVKEYTP